MKKGKAFGLAAVMVIMAVAAYFNDKRLKRIEKKIDENNIIDVEGEVIEDEQTV